MNVFTEKTTPSHMEVLGLKNKKVEQKSFFLRQKKKSKAMRGVPTIVLSAIASIMAYRYMARKVQELRDMIQRNPLSLVFKLIQFVKPGLLQQHGITATETNNNTITNTKIRQDEPATFSRTFLLFLLNCDIFKSKIF